MKYNNIHKILLLGVFFIICFFGSIQQSFAATLNISPSTGVYTAGQTFTARVVVNTTGANVNAAEGTLAFNPAELSVVRVVKGSIFSLWTAEPSFSNSAGTISFSGGTPSGYSGAAGTVLSVTFRVKGAGTQKVTFRSGAVLAADGRGTNVLTSMSGGTYTSAAVTLVPDAEVVEYIAPANTPARPMITSTTHIDAEKWYASTDAELAWTIPDGVLAVRTLLDEYSGSIPTKVYDNPISKISLTELDEGEQYFHLQFKNKEGWGRVAHYRLAVDTHNPTSFTISLPQDADLSNPIQSLVLSADDVTSPVQRFIITINSNEPYEFIDTEEKGIIQLESLAPGHHSIVIEAFDAAGNSLIDSLSFEIAAFEKPIFTEYPSELSESVIPVIKGVTRPNAEVKITFSKKGSDSQEIVVMSSESGDFVFIPEARLSLGVYELTAVAVDEYGAQSEVSDIIRIAVQQPGYIKVGSLVVSILSVVIPLLALTLLLILGLWFTFTKLRRMRIGVTRESEEALQILHKEFQQLHHIMQTEADALASTRKTNKLTKAEASLVDTVQDALDTAKKRVEKEIMDVETIVN